MRSCLFLAFLLLQVSAFGGTLEGYVMDTNGAPLPFCNIYLRENSLTAVSNEDGFYKLQAPAGKYTVVFQYIGYQKTEREVELEANAVLRLDVSLETELMELHEVVIRADAEDPAYPIIRLAIAKRETHLREINSFSCRAYIKGLQKFTEAPDKILGIQLNTILDVDSNNTGIVYLSESASTFHFQYPDKTKEIMHASKVSGDNRGFSFNDAASMQMNFYHNMETIQGFTQRGLVSPIADNALFFYTYKLLGTMEDGEHTIYKIEVTPKRASDPVLKGLVYITDHDHRLFGLSLEAGSANGIEFLDTFRVEQEYFYVDSIPVVLSTRYTFSYDFFGIRGNGYFHGHYSDFTINPVFPEKFFTGEVSRIQEGANKQDSVYWAGIRPMQLSDEESADYHEKALLAAKKETRAYQDSVDKVINAFRWSHLIGGYVYQNNWRNFRFGTSTLAETIQFNTIESWVFQPTLSFTKNPDTAHEWSVSATLRYASAIQGISSLGTVRFRPEQFHGTQFTISGGSTVRQYNNYGISPSVNSVYTLFLEENYLKLFGCDFIQLHFRRELWNGVYFSLETEYANRYRLHNAPEIFTLIDREAMMYAPNDVFSTSADTILLSAPMPDLLRFGLRVRYVIGQTYITLPDDKFAFDSKYPTIHAAVQTFSYPDSLLFVQFSLGVDDAIKLGLAGSFTYTISGKYMPGTNLPDLADRLHAAGNETHISRLAEAAFFMLPYYYASSTDHLVTAHAQWHTDGFIFRKIPLFKQLQLDPVFSVNYLTSGTANAYLEVAAGLEHIFKIGRVDLAYTPSSDISPNFRILLGIGF